MRPPLIAVAHGSRDPRSAATMHAVVANLRATHPDLDVRLAFLDLNAPSVESIVAGVAADGHRSAVVVPLLLGAAFHARIDLPGMLAAARARHPRLQVTQADVLGPDPLLVSALRDRIVRTGADPADNRIGIAVAAVGSTSAEANERTRRVVDDLVAGTAWRAELCFATREPSVGSAVARLRSRTGTAIVVAPWFLAPGTLTDRLAAAVPDVTHSAPIGAHPVLSEIVAARYAQQLRSCRAA